MPSVGTRQSPRVLRAQVLRSGRRLLMEFHDRGKNMREAHGRNKLIQILDDLEDGGGHVNDLWENLSLENGENILVNISEEHHTKPSAHEWTVEENNVDKRWGVVYQRKRKRTHSAVEASIEDKKSGIKLYERRKKRKHLATEESEISPEIDLSHSDMAMSSNDNIESRDLQQPSLQLKKYELRNVQSRNSRKIQKRRAFLRPKTGVRVQKASGVLASKFVKIRKGGSHLYAVAPTRVRRSLVNKSSATNIINLNSPLGVSKCDLSCCMANILITEADKCYREVGATIALELLDSRRWVIVVAMNGENRYNLTAEKTMRPSTWNRFTHSTIWMVDCSWKLEFPNKLDWLIFKELYKKCFDRNMLEPETSDVPVPGVREVSNSFNTSYVPFVRPETYITVNDDELTRVLVKENATYDMDSDDEVWLAKLNDDLGEFITPERFELIVDAIEKGYYCNPNEEATCASCVHSESMEIIDAIRSHWMQTRKHNRSALVRILQLYQPRRGLVITKPVLRKKRTFKRQGSSNIGRGKERTFLQAVAVDRLIGSEQRDSEGKLRQAEADAERSERLATLKRERAQKLMENADLATYKAVMALKFAESAKSLNK